MAVVGVLLTSPIRVEAMDEVEAAVQEHARLVYRIAYAVTRDHHDAEDATQETFLRVLRYRKRLAAARDRRTWIAAIAWRIAARRARRATEHIHTDALTPAELDALAALRSAAPGADQALIRQQHLALLRRLVESLPRDLRDVIVLSTVRELGSAEIAQVLGIPETSVRTRLLRARVLLKEKLAALLGGTHVR